MENDHLRCDGETQRGKKNKGFKSPTLSLLKSGKLAKYAWPLPLYLKLKTFQLNAKHVNTMQTSSC